MKIIYFYHIPKCAGTTISDILKKIAISESGLYQNFDYVHINKLNNDQKRINNLEMRTFLDSLNNKTAHLKIIHHHHGYCGIGQIYNKILVEKKKAIDLGNKIYFFTCIREPISFHISRLNFLKNSCGMKDITFHEICKNKKNHNLMSKYFMRNHPARWDDFSLEKERFLKCLNLMDKVFVIENICLLYSWLEKILDIELFDDKSIINTRKNVGQNKLLPTSEEYEILKKVNSFDRIFYDLACSENFKNTFF